MAWVWSWRWCSLVWVTPPATEATRSKEAAACLVLRCFAQWAPSPARLPIWLRPAAAKSSTSHAAEPRKSSSCTKGVSTMTTFPYGAALWAGAPRTTFGAARTYISARRAAHSARHHAKPQRFAEIVDWLQEAQMYKPHFTGLTNMASRCAADSAASTEFVEKHCRCLDANGTVRQRQVLCNLFHVGNVLTTRAILCSCLDVLPAHSRCPTQLATSERTK